MTFVEDYDEKRHALKVMIRALEAEPVKVIKKQLTKKSITGVQIGRIDIEYLSGKKSEKVIISL